MNIMDWTEQDVKDTLPKREADSHKGTFGKALLLAGSDDMPGAALLAGLGAMRSGVGKLVIGTSAGVIPLIVPVLPEATYWRDGWKKPRRASPGKPSGPLPSGRAFPKQTKCSRRLISCFLAIIPSYWMRAPLRKEPIRRGKLP